MESIPSRKISDDKRHLENVLKWHGKTEQLWQRNMISQLPPLEQSRANAEIVAIRKEYASPVLR